MARPNSEVTAVLPQMSKADFKNIKYQLAFWNSALSIPISTAKPPVAVHLWAGKTDLSAVPISGSGNFDVKPDDSVYFKLRSAEGDVYVYAVKVDEKGVIHSKSDFLPSRGGNPVRRQRDTSAMVQDPPPDGDMEEWHFFFCPNAIDEYATPPSDGSQRGVPPPATALVGATHYVVTLQSGQTLP